MQASPHALRLDLMRCKYTAADLYHWTQMVSFDAAVYNGGHTHYNGLTKRQIIARLEASAERRGWDFDRPPFKLPTDPDAPKVPPAPDLPPLIAVEPSPLLPMGLPVKSTNPKRAMGQKKPPMHLIPEAPLVHMTMAFKDGAEKYGPYNWRQDPVDVSTYVAAAKRHLGLYFNGQDYTSDTNVHNLGAVMACCAIILDAHASGSLIDDRPPAQDLEAVVDMFTVGKGLPIAA